MSEDPPHLKSTKTEKTHKKQAQKNTILFFGEHRHEQPVQLLCQATCKKYFRECKHKWGYTTTTGMFLHCVTLKCETHHSGDKGDKCYSFPSVQSWENTSSLLNSAHSAWLQFYNATLHWLGIWAWMMNAVYSHNFKKFGLVFFLFSFLSGYKYMYDPLMLWMHNEPPGNRHGADIGHTKSPPTPRDIYLQHCLPRTSHRCK